MANFRWSQHEKVHKNVEKIQFRNLLFDQTYILNYRLVFLCFKARDTTLIRDRAVGICH